MQYNEIRRRDANVISFLIGCSGAFSLLLVAILLMPSSDGDDHWDEIASTMDIYTLTGTICFILFAAGFAVQVFRRYNINYTFIFEVDQTYKMIHH